MSGPQPRRWWGRGLRLAAALLLSALCLAWLGRQVDLAALAARWRDVPMGHLVGGVLLAWTFPFWRAARLRACLPPDAHVTPGSCWRIVAEALLWAFLLPFKLGELSLPLLIHRRLGVALLPAAGLFLLLRLADVAVIVGMLAVALASLGLLVETPVWRAALALAGGGLLLLPLALPRLGRVLATWPPFERRWLRLALDGLTPVQSSPVRVRLLLTSWGLWVTQAALVALMAHAAGLRVAVDLVALASAAGNLAFALPVNGLLGLGPQQAALAATLQAGGVPWDAAVAVAIATYLAVLIGALTTGTTAWLWQAVGASATSSPRRGADP